MNRTITLLLILIPFLRLSAGEMLPIVNYSPSAYHAETQNWCIRQSSNGNIYVANNKGILEFNGAAWNVIPSENQTVMRSLCVNGDRLYSGCYMEFGYWQKDNAGHLTYVSLSRKIKNRLEDDEQFWKIICVQQWVLFQSLHRIYIYDTKNDNYQIINSKSSLPKMFEAGGKVYFQKMDEGIFVLKNGKSELISDNDLFKNNIIINIYQKEDGLLVEFQNDGFFLIKKGQVSAWKTAFSPQLNSLSVYSSIRLRDGNFALGTIGDGLFIVSSEGDVIYHIDKKSGLQNNTVLSLFQDRDDNIWLALDNGISCVNYSSAFRVYNDTKGIFGTVYTSAEVGEFLYLGTNQGLYYKKTNSGDDFQLVNGTKGQVWMLKMIDGVLFCGHNDGTFIIQNEKAFKIASQLGTWDIQPIPGNANLLLQGNYEGLNVLERINGQWRYRNRIKGFNMSSRYFNFLNNRQLFVSHEYKGLFKLETDSNYRNVVSYKLIRDIKTYPNAGMTWYEGQIIYFNSSGIFEYKVPKGKFVLNKNLTAEVFRNDNYISGKMIVDNADKLWLFTQNNIISLIPGGIDNKFQISRIALPFALRENVAGYENLLPIHQNTYLLGTSNGYILFNLDKYKPHNYTVWLNSVAEWRMNSEKVYLTLNGQNDPLKSTDNNLEFSFNVPVFERFNDTKYQYILEGFDSRWSDWSSEPTAQFKNLPSGDYTFRVRAKIGNQLTENIAAFHFSINRPWYLSNWMIVVYFLLLLLLLSAVNHIYRLNYQRHKEKLDQEKQKELELMQAQNEKELMKLRNERLSFEIEAKNKELASTTMAIVKKNELLNTIKNELVHEREIRAVKSVIQFIDDNLENNSDWEAFQEAFNSVDRDFLKKVKQLHPSLTPNDMKLCVYLRLNLSSKEIANMLNISPQSVEIKRFRLRKKMDLDHEQNLTEYILNI